MPGHNGGYRPSHRSPEQVKIAEDIEDLVARELVGEAQLGIDNLIVPDDDAIVELAAADQSHGLEVFDVAQETESPRNCNEPG